ncbi:PAP2 superfamily protein [Cnuella takakiae]|uniref:PAP2 superfamily protein n=1 Tax=Cnuella takakiae TaxID=1302690 RepID=A0A1M4VFK0_9BACT|nr:vanadium-dependent haloperoxidase [Cnuella takakiae]OLY92614.1 phosphoesterase PA-phosphatase [Cnuella takakiae]SHE67630.1 PAP2 superfamily protein [Cnuella takakiae]
MKQIVWCCLVAVSLFACKPKDYTKYTHDPFLYAKTVKQLNDVVLQNNFSPVVASRNYAYANIAAYECIAAGDSSYRTLHGQIRHLPQMPRPAAGQQVDYQLAALLSFVKVGNAVTFPEGVLMDYYEQLKNGADSAGMSSDMLDATVAFSDTISATIMQWSKKDQYAQTRSSEKFTVLNEDGRWVPTPPMYAQAMEPHWCDIRPLVLDTCTQFMPPAPPKFDLSNKNSAFYKDLMEVKTTVDSLNEEQKHIAEFFDDNPFKMNVQGHVMFATKKFSPPGHWMNIVGIAAKKAGADFNTTVAAYTQTSIALFDGFISCWKAKFSSNTVRPETVINKNIDPEWRPFIQTPPFPSYISGHSVISAASAEVMTHFFGEPFQYTDTSLVEFGIKERSFKSFRQAADEASMSRLYGGIHYRCDLEEGQKVGYQLGKYVVTKLELKRKSSSAVQATQPVAAR